MAGNSKRFKGQQQVVQGSMVGEPIIIERFDYSSADCCNLKYYGQAKVGSKDNQPRWHIECFEYDSCGNVTAIKTATCKIMPKASSIDVDPSAGSSSQTKLTIPDGSFFQHYAAAGDKITLKTASNTAVNKRIAEFISDTEILIEGVLTAEVGTAITTDDLYISLARDDEVHGTKDYHRRRWDLRSCYAYE